mgnify:CR=1 FL=1
MSSYFARSINKAPAYLSPCRRPTIGRTLSNSSDLSLTSNCSGRSEDVGDTVTSAPGTPTLEALDQRHHSSKRKLPFIAAFAICHSSSHSFYFTGP